MKPTADAFILVHSLSQGEQDYFRKFHNGFKKNEEQQYKELFEAILKEEEYDEAAFKQKHKGNGFLNNFSYNKLYLIQLILDALKYRERPNKPRVYQMREFLEEAWLLRIRKLPKAAEKRIRKVIRQATELENHELHIEALKLLRDILISVEKVEYSGEIVKVFAEMKRISEVIQNKTELRELKDRIFIFARNMSLVHDQLVRQELDEIMSHDLLRNKTKFLSFDASNYYWYAHALYQQLIGDYEKCWPFHLEIVKLWRLEKNKLIKEDRIYFYRNILNNFLQLSNELDKDELFLEALSELDTGTESKWGEPGRSRLNFLVNAIHFHIRKCRWEDAFKVQKEYEATEKLMETHILLSRRMAFFLTFSSLHFITANFSEAYRWNEEILSLKKSQVRRDIWIFSHFFKLMILLEKNEEGIPWDSAFRAANYRLKEISEGRRFERSTLDFLKTLVKLPSGPERVQRFKSFSQELDQLSTITDERFSQGFWVTWNWVKGKSQGISLQEQMELGE